MLPSIGPTSYIKDQRLVVVSSWLLRLLTLGCFCKRVIVDPRRKAIGISSWYFWFLVRRRVISYPMIEAITYGFTDLIGVGWFTIGLRLSDESEIYLYSFFGLDHTAVLNSNQRHIASLFEPDTVNWESVVVEFEASQRLESKNLVSNMARLIGTTVVSIKDERLVRRFDPR